MIHVCISGTIDECNNCVNDKLDLNPFMENCKLVETDNLNDICKAPSGTKVHDTKLEV